MITIVDVCRDMGVDPNSDLTWKVGAEVRRIWEEHTGVPPHKDLRTKTNGAGSHCFALYPAQWYGKIEEVIRSFETEKARQYSLFAERDEDKERRPEAP